jgi:hypothetical protein
MKTGCSNFPSTLFPEHGCLWVVGVGDEAITEYGIECPRQIIDDEGIAERPVVARRRSPNNTQRQPARRLPHSPR